jgi:hypothetical protein
VEGKQTPPLTPPPRPLTPPPQPLVDDLRDKLQRLEVTSQNNTTTEEKDAQVEEVRVNVRGQIFTATRATLTEGDAADTFLAALFSDRWNEDAASSFAAARGEEEETSCTKIDRDPTLFSHVLSWLRDGSVHDVDESGPELRLALVEEADYYGLTSLVDALTGWRHRVLSLSEENREIFEAENRIRKILVAPAEDPPLQAGEGDIPLTPLERDAAHLAYLQTLADSMLIDVFDEKDSFVVDVAPPPASEALTFLVDNRASSTSNPSAAVSAAVSPLVESSICGSLVEFKHVTFKFFTLDTLRGLDWTGVLVAGGAVLGSLLPLPDKVQDDCFLPPDLQLDDPESPSSTIAGGTRIVIVACPCLVSYSEKYACFPQHFLPGLTLRERCVDITPWH